ncbi:MAG: rhodanese-like domain-containing protein [Planctomycetota bacterium]
MLRRLFATALALVLAGCSRGSNDHFDPTVAPYPNAANRTPDELAALDAQFESMCAGYDQQTGAPQLTAAELKQMLAAGKPVVVFDVREPAEFEAAHLPDARLLPPATVGDSTAVTDDLPADAVVVAYCTAGLRSGKAAVQLEQRLGRKVLNLHGGIVAWFNAGGELRNQAGQPVQTLHPYGEQWGKHVHARSASR